MDDYFEDAPGKESAPAVDQQQQQDGGDKEAGDEQTYLVQREAYPDAKPGDTFTMRVVRVHSGEMECSVEKDGEHEEGEEPMTEQAQMPAAMAGGGDSMMD